MNTHHIKVKTRGNCDVINITPEVKALADKEKLEEAVIFLTVIGSTAGLTTMEYEPGLKQDLKQAFEQLLPYKKDYAHNSTWSDDNGHSHLRSSFIKTGLFVSVTAGSLDLGTWQQVVLIDFDTRPRERKIVVKILT
ncbi:MAG: secondary thiamine-phosphate synthase enzyme YjbQ [Candidatus Omnitrophica bacterium]|nr:secondary thiamine-phosphate synthase enzyme YjbQ [Candidatus Omnitrophota bacterium]MBU2044260.1 secondary thiamine-phosphate synthase enzyme YjbQ [Candidatus Omnitrophota bacterium]MBU2251514.1 secondary thiamine-phosphate synthase enzyme YjbQ [Candidatus Omnitrophota bacterium]MBU2266081.1 secondary thiamine-phosphate synthase enzyme YjbQ [Candidatus Omnitrophota bacterium]MBU2474063.1 secondary thiamine-phosphate synthase enzyme YjbQ [Candidatus Omnitrophota bacterium]